MVICGATATGKTRLSLELASRLAGAELVSADSRQVYRGMDIGTAKVAPDVRARVPHHCLDVVEPDEPFTAADYVRHALTALADIAARGAIALMVGGTGLYLRAVARGLPLETSGHDRLLRARLEERLASEGLAVLAAELEGHDPAAARSIDLRNPRRVVRALERLMVAGTALPPPARGYPAPQLWLGLEVEPDRHRREISERVRDQFEGGLLAEAAELLSRYGEDLPAFSAMGYREAFDVLAGRLDLGSAVSLTARRTWAYARRQRTWFRSEPGITWLAGEGSTGRAEDLVRRFLEAGADNR